MHTLCIVSQQFPDFIWQQSGQCMLTVKQCKYQCNAIKPSPGGHDSDFHSKIGTVHANGYEASHAHFLGRYMTITVHCVCMCACAMCSWENTVFIVLVHLLQYSPAVNRGGIKLKLKLNLGIRPASLSPCRQVCMHHQLPRQSFCTSLNFLQP